MQHYSAGLPVLQVLGPRLIWAPWWEGRLSVGVSCNLSCLLAGVHGCPRTLLTSVQHEVFACVCMQALMLLFLIGVTEAVCSLASTTEGFTEVWVQASMVLFLIEQAGGVWSLVSVVTGGPWAPLFLVTCRYWAVKR